MNTKTQSNTASRTDVHTRITETIVADLEQGVRPWMKPWSADTGCRLQRADLDDLSPGIRAERSGPQGRDR